MYPRQCVLLLIALSVTVSNVEGSDPKADSVSELASFTRAKLEAARRTFTALWNDKEWDNVETPYGWSRHWLEAQCQVGDTWEDRIAAFQQHLDRMRDLGQFTKKQFRARLGTIYHVNATEFYIAEATEWLARAKAEDRGSMTKR